MDLLLLFLLHLLFFCLFPRSNGPFHLLHPLRSSRDTRVPSANNERNPIPSGSPHHDENTTLSIVLVVVVKSRQPIGGTESTAIFGGKGPSVFLDVASTRLAGRELKSYSVTFRQGTSLFWIAVPESLLFLLQLILLRLWRWISCRR